MSINETSYFQSKLPKSLEPDAYSETFQATWNFCTTVSGSTFLHNMLASTINPATAQDPEKKIKLDQFRVELFDSNGKYKAEQVKLLAADGNYVEGAFFPGTSRDVILFALGAGGCYEATANPEDAAHDFVQFFREKIGGGINVLVINTRGICNSGNGPSVQGSALDYYAAWNYLEAKGLTVLPWGHSLGFRYVVEAAAWKQEESPEIKINIVSDRSFDDLATEVQEYLGGKKGVIAGGIARYAGYGGNIQEQWNSLKGKKLILVAPQDPIVPYQTASFFKGIQGNPVHTDATVIKLRGEEKVHTRIYNAEEEQAILAELNLMLRRTNESGLPKEEGLAKPLKTKPKEQTLLDNKALISVVTVVGVLVLSKAYGFVKGE
jgi:hypothetical protein